MGSIVAPAALGNVLYGKRDGVAYVTVNRPKVLNALNGKTVAELTVVFEQAGKDSSLEGVILPGAGSKLSSQVRTLSELARPTVVEAEQFSRSAQAVFDLIENLGKPVIAAVNGFALGGGCEAAMACTIRLAAEGAKFGQPEVKLGIIPCFGGPSACHGWPEKGWPYNSSCPDKRSALKKRIALVLSTRSQLIPRAEAILKQISGNASID